MKVKEPKQYVAYMVTWEDSCASPGWHGHSEFLDFANRGALIIKTLGWKVGETKGTIILAQSVGDYHMGELYLIPKSAILDMHKVGEKTEKGEASERPR